jgi:hypothetical protein
MLVPPVENGKMPHEPLNATHGFYLPTDTPYGNLTLKLFKIIQRLDHVNLRIQKLNGWFERRGQPYAAGMLMEYLYAAEDAYLGDEIIFWLKRTVDELIALVYLKNYWVEHGRGYPQKLKISYIGALLNRKDPVAGRMRPAFSKHFDFFNKLNSLANAHKHSFVGTDLSITSAAEPHIFALEMYLNDSRKPVELHAVPVRAVVKSFNEFYRDALQSLRAWSAASLQAEPFSVMVK